MVPACPLVSVSTETGLSSTVHRRVKGPGLDFNIDGVFFSDVQNDVVGLVRLESLWRSQ